MMEYSSDAGQSGSHVDDQSFLGTGSPKAVQRDEWLGEKYLAYKLAERLIRDTSEIDINKATSLNGILTKQLAEFDYDTCRRELRNTGMRVNLSVDLDADEREIALGWIGAIQSRGTRKEQDTLASIILQCPAEFSRNMESISDPPQAPIGSSAAATQSPRPGAGGDGDNDDEESAADAHIWQYTSKLQEMTAGRLNIPIYEESIVRFQPPLFRVVVKYRENTATGEARNKKLAKHRASKKLCQLLSINVPGAAAAGPAT